MLPEDAESMQYWSAGTYFAFKPQNAWDEWVGHRVALIMMKIHRSEVVERRLRDLQALTAIDCWETDRRLAAEKVARNLVRHPQQTYQTLLDSLAGCDWLVARWDELNRIPIREWTEAQRTLASMIQPGGPDEPLTPGFVERWLGIMRDRRTSLLAADAALRTLAEHGLATEASRALAQQQRETRALQRQLKWYVAQLRHPLPARWDNPRFFPTFQATPTEPASPPETTPGAAAPGATQGDAAPATTDDRHADGTNPSADPAPEATPVTTPTAPLAADPVAGDQPGPPARQRFADLPDEAKAARVAERKRRVDPARAVAQLRRADRRSA